MILSALRMAGLVAAAGLLAGLVGPAQTPRAADVTPLPVYAWHVTLERHPHTYPNLVIHYDNTSGNLNYAAVGRRLAMSSKVLPDEHVVLRDISQFHRLRVGHPDDTTILWCDHGTEAVRRHLREFLRAYQALGGKPITYCMWDDENGVGYWQLSNRARAESSAVESHRERLRELMAAAMTDPRWPELREELGEGFDDLTRLVPFQWARRDLVYRFNDVLEWMNRDSIRRAYADVIREFYPGATFTNYGSFRMIDERLPDDGGHLQTWTAPTLGDAVAFAAYGLTRDSLHEGMLTWKPEGRPLPDSPWGRLQHSIARYRSILASSPELPVHLWVTSPAFNRLRSADNGMGDYYEEFMRQMLAHCPRLLLYWNAPDREHPDHRAKAWERDFFEIRDECQALNVAAGTLLTTAWPSFHRDWVVTGFDDGRGSQVYRVSFDPDATDKTLPYTVDGEVRTAVPDASGSGAWIVLPAGAEVSFGPPSDDG